MSYKVENSSSIAAPPTKEASKKCHKCNESFYFLFIRRDSKSYVCHGCGHLFCFNCIECRPLPLQGFASNKTTTVCVNCVKQHQQNEAEFWISQLLSIYSNLHNTTVVGEFLEPSQAKLDIMCMIDNLNQFLYKTNNNTGRQLIKLMNTCELERFFYLYLILANSFDDWLEMIVRSLNHIQTQISKSQQTNLNLYELLDSIKCGMSVKFSNAIKKSAKWKEIGDRLIQICFKLSSYSSLCAELAFDCYQLHGSHLTTSEHIACACSFFKLGEYTLAYKQIENSSIKFSTLKRDLDKLPKNVDLEDIINKNKQDTFLLFWLNAILSFERQLSKFELIKYWLEFAAYLYKIESKQLAETCLQIIQIVFSSDELSKYLTSNYSINSSSLYKCFLKLADAMGNGFEATKWFKVLELLVENYKNDQDRVPLANVCIQLIDRQNRFSREEMEKLLGEFAGRGECIKVFACAYYLLRRIEGVSSATTISVKELGDYFIKRKRITYGCVCYMGDESLGEILFECGQLEASDERKNWAIALEFQLADYLNKLNLVEEAKVINCDIMVSSSAVTSCLLNVCQTLFDSQNKTLAIRLLISLIFNNILPNVKGNLI